MSSRREFLKFLGAGALTASLPDSIQRAYAIAPDAGSTYLDAEHIVLLMQENRSFDHVLGTLSGVRGFNDPRALRLPNGKSVFIQADAAGNSCAPWRLDIKDTRITWMGSLPHSRESQVDAWNEGRHDGWLTAKRSGEKEYAAVPMTMGYYTRKDLPFLYALADAFTVCDQHYCSVMTSTSPNRSLFWTGTIRDQQTAHARAYIRNEQYDHMHSGWKTYPERLQEAGIRWKCYQNELSYAQLAGEHDAWLGNFGDNILEYFPAYKVSGHGLTPAEGALHRAAFVTNSAGADFRELEELSFMQEGKTQTMRAPKGDVLYQFRKDVEDGHLPTVSWLTAPEKFSDHPTSPWYGAWYLSEVLNILTSNPEVWKKTIFILTYDENDGYFDHAPSFVAADPKRPETGGASSGIDTGVEYLYAEDELAHGVEKKSARSGPIGMGFRVPMIVASPWTRGGWVNSQLFDHSSTLMFLENFVQAKYGKRVREENISDWRRAVSGDLTSVFRPAQKTDPRLDPVDRDKFLISIERARDKEIPSNYRNMGEFTSPQESESRPSSALPYELYADGALSADGASYSLSFRAGNSVHGDKSAGAPFNVYLRNLREEGGFRAATYAVKAGDVLSRQFPLSLFASSKYSIEVHAPNGFYRSFAGDSSSRHVGVRIAYEGHGGTATGNIVLSLSNATSEQMVVEVADKSYNTGTVRKTLSPGKTVELVQHLSASHGWYDFTVKAEGSSAESRFAGRVECGRSSFTDPLLG